MQQRTAVGLVACWSPSIPVLTGWATCAKRSAPQSRDVWERRPQDEEKIWVKYFRDLISLIGLLVALIITPSITSVAGSAQQMIISALYLDNIEWLKPAWRLIGLAISILPTICSFLDFLARRAIVRGAQALFRGTLIAAIGFGNHKNRHDLTLPALVKSVRAAFDRCWG